MKVSGVGAGSSTGGVRRTDKSSGASGASGSEFRRALVDAVEGPDDTPAVDTTGALGSVDALLVVQAAGDATEREARRRLVRRGEEILDRLEDVRRALLLGVVPKDMLLQLAQMVRSRREATPDPRLAALLDEIELRAEVELAKLTREL